jgi:cell division protein FtsI/penicillin-binding protein 2
MLNIQNIISKLKKILFFTFVFIFFFVIFLYIIGSTSLKLQKEKTPEIIAKIRNTKLTIDDVMGKNLPPEPDPLIKDATLAGVDVNQNNIRDDVELAIFKQYPNSAKMRAQLLQYAMSLQLMMTVPFVNKDIAGALIEENGRAYLCIGSEIPPEDFLKNSKKIIEETDSLVKFVEDLQFNSIDRKNAEKNFYKKVRSYGQSPNKECDIDFSLLPN